MDNERDALERNNSDLVPCEDCGRLFIIYSHHRPEGVFFGTNTGKDVDLETAKIIADKADQTIAEAPLYSVESHNGGRPIFRCPKYR